jgi:hypothetical protein
LRPSPRTSFHHQPEAQHPKSSAIHKLGRPITPSDKTGDKDAHLKRDAKSDGKGGGKPEPKHEAAQKPETDTELP